MSDGNPYFGSTFAERKAARKAAEKKAPPVVEPKQVDDDSEQVEDKAIAPAKATRKRTAKKS